jgi:hypothetical protein
VLLGNPGPGPEIGKIPEFFEVPVPIPSPDFYVPISNREFSLFCTGSDEFFVNKIYRKRNLNVEKMGRFFLAWLKRQK